MKFDFVKVTHNKTMTRRWEEGGGRGIKRRKEILRKEEENHF